MLIDRYPILGQLQRSLVEVVPDLPVSVTGQWTSARRRRVGNGFLSIPIPHRQGDETVALELTGHRTGHLSRRARKEDAELYLYILPGSLVKTGRKGIWHLRHAYRARLPSGLTVLLTRGRHGEVPPELERNANRITAE